MYFDVLNHYIYKKIQEHNNGSFRWNLLFKNTNLKHDLKFFLGIFFQVNLEIFYYYYDAINWVNVI